MDNKIIDYLILGGFGVCGFLIGWFYQGEKSYKEYSKELETLLKKHNKMSDRLIKESDESIKIRDEIIENLIEIIRQENPELGKMIEKKYRKSDFTVVKDEEA